VSKKRRKQCRVKDVYDVMVRDIHDYWLQGVLKRDGKMIAMALEDIASAAMRFFDVCGDNEGVCLVMTFQLKLDSCLYGIEDQEDIRDLFVFLRDTGIRLQVHGYDCTASICYQMYAMYGRRPAADWPIFGLKAGEIMARDGLAPPDDSAFGLS